jgi:hypothetical protein
MEMPHLVRVILQNLPGEQLGNVQGTFRERLRNSWGTVGILQGTFGILQGTFGLLQGTMAS